MTDLNEWDISETLHLDLECLVDGLRQVIEDGAHMIAYGPREGTRGAKVITLWLEDGSEQLLFPDCLDDLCRILNAMPSNPPDDQAA